MVKCVFHDVHEAISNGKFYEILFSLISMSYRFLDDMASKLKMESANHFHLDEITYK